MEVSPLLLFPDLVFITWKFKKKQQIDLSLWSVTRMSLTVHSFFPVRIWLEFELSSQSPWGLRWPTQSLFKGVTVLLNKCTVDT